MIALLVATPDIDPSPLKRLDDGAKKHAVAVAALLELHALIEPYRKLHSKAAEAEQRFRLDRDEDRRKQDHAAHIADLRTTFIEMQALAPQARGYALERFMTRLFDVHDMDARGPLTGDGEQIDGAFTFDGADYLLEAKWQQELTSNPDISIFRDKVRRRLENTSDCSSRSQASNRPF